MKSLFPSIDPYAEDIAASENFCVCCLINRDDVPVSKHVCRDCSKEVAETRRQIMGKEVLF